MSLIPETDNPDQMTFRRQTWSAFDSANDTSSLDSGLRHGNGLTEAVRQICNYIPVKTSSWILKSCWQSPSIFSGGRPQAISCEISTAWSTMISEVHYSLQTRLVRRKQKNKKIQSAWEKATSFSRSVHSPVSSLQDATIMSTGKTWDISCILILNPSWCFIFRLEMHFRRQTLCIENI